MIENQFLSFVSRESQDNTTINIKEDKISYESQKKKTSDKKNIFDNVF